MGWVWESQPLKPLNNPSVPPPPATPTAYRPLCVVIGLRKGLVLIPLHQIPLGCAHKAQKNINRLFLFFTLRYLMAHSLDKTCSLFDFHGMCLTKMTADTAVLNRLSIIKQGDLVLKD